MKTLEATTPRVLLAAGLLVLTGCVSTFKEIKPLAGGGRIQPRPSLINNSARTFWSFWKTPCITLPL